MLPFVTALLVLRDGSRWLPEVLDALAEQQRPPDRLVVLDLASTDGSAALVGDHAALHAAIPAWRMLPQVGDPAASFEAAIDATVATLDRPEQAPESERPEWLWLLPDDCAPAADALARLVGAVRRSPSVGVVGPKVLDWERPRQLLEVGQLLTRSGRRLAAPAPGETDQGQYDTRTDVLAVGAAGMLVRRALFERVGGFGASPAARAAALDLGWRAQLAGERVVVVPSAAVRSAAAPYAAPRPESPPATLRSRRLERSATRRVALTRCAGWAAPLLALWIGVSAVVAAAALLLLKRPRHAWLELGDLAALAHPWSSWRSRWRFRRRRVLRRRDLATVFVTTGEAVRHTGDRVHDALTPGSRDRTASTVLASAESGPVAEEAEDLAVLPASLPQRILTHPGVLATLAAGGVAAVGMRTSLRGGLLDAQGSGLVGGELARVATDAAGLWHGFRDSWAGAGFGGPGEQRPLTGLLAALVWVVERLPYVSDGRSPASVLLAWTLVLGMPAATATAYVAARVATPARWTRALAALAWGCSGVLAAAVSSGRVGLVIAHVLLPLVVAGIVRTARADGTFTAAAATALAAGALGACVPVALVPVAAAALVMTLVGPGLARRVRALALLVLPLGMQGPALLTWQDPIALLGGPGTLDTTAPDALPWWQTLLGQPDGGPVGLICLATGIVLALAVASLWRRARGRGGAVAVAALAVLGVLGVAHLVLARHLVLGSVLGPDGHLHAATPWQGIGAQWLLAAALGLALAGSVGLRQRLSAAATPARVAAVVGLVALAGVLGAAAGQLGWQRLDGVVTVGRDPLPAAAVEHTNGPDGGRLLVLVPGADAVDYQLVGAEPGQVLRDRFVLPQFTDPGLHDVVAALAAGGAQTSTGPTTGGPATAGAGAALADLGIGYVSLRADGDQALARTLDAAPGLTRLGTTDGQTLWRVQARPAATSAAEVVPVGRLRVVTAAGGVALGVRVDGPHGQTTTMLPAGPPGRALVVAEPTEWATVAEVRYDGVRLSATSGTGMPTYALPERAGVLTIDVPPTHRRWFLAQLAVVLLTIFLAVPFGNRRSRRLS